MREIAADQRRLIAGIEALRAAGRLADLAHALAPSSGARKDSPAAEVTALAERIRAAARRPNVAPEVREALEKVAETLSEDGGKLGSPKEPSPNAGGSRDSSGDLVRGKGRGAVDESTIQSLRESDAGAGAAGTMTSRAMATSRRKRHPASVSAADPTGSMRPRGLPASRRSSAARPSKRIRKGPDRHFRVMPGTIPTAARRPPHTRTPPPAHPIVAMPSRLRRFPKGAERPFRATSSANNDVHQRRAVESISSATA